MPKRRSPALEGPKPVACDGRRRVLVPAHYRCVSSLARDQAPRIEDEHTRDLPTLDYGEDEHADLPTLNGMRRRKGRGFGALEQCEVHAMPVGNQTYYWMTCTDGEEEDVVSEMYVTREKPTKDACREGHSRKCAKALTSLPFIRTVDSIETYGRNKRKGYGTKLYERAAKDACEAGEPLVSYLRLPDSASNAFWKKQHEKGRAVAAGAYKRFEKRGSEEIMVSEPIYALQCGAHKDLSGAGKKRKKR